MDAEMHIQIETELLPQKPAVTQGKALRGGPNPVGFSLPDAHQIRMDPKGPTINLKFNLRESRGEWGPACCRKHGWLSEKGHPEYQYERNLRGFANFPRGLTSRREPE